ncbi:DUF397 domain-containing protein [Actinopolyspora lacussalsi]
MTREHPAPHTWRKPSRSANNAHCVEVGFADNTIAVRDTKDRAGGALTVTPAIWAGFLNHLKTGDYDQG